jgi:AcrR family transcriptional regulator
MPDAQVDAASPPAQPRRRDPASTREAILRAARELVAECGPEAMALSEVAHRAGVNRGTLYQHFRNRDELADAVMLTFAGQLKEILGGDLPVGERIDRFLEFFLDHPEFARLWAYDLLTSSDTEPRESWQAFIRSLDSLAQSERSAPGIDTESLARILVGAPLFWALRVQKQEASPEDRRAAVKRFATEMKRLLLYGVMSPSHFPTMVAEVESPSRD